MPSEHHTLPEPLATGPALFAGSSTPDPYDSQAPPSFSARFQHRYWVHLLLFVATLATTTLVGALHYDAFQAAFQARPPRFDFATVIGGFWYSGSLLAILGAHEMGHYFMCRRHRVDATLPYFLPAPLPLTGTIGAFIRIREMFPNKAVLFDIGVGGPIAGFVVLVPALFWGLRLSNIAPLPEAFDGLSLGEPLLFQAASQMVWGSIPEGASINLHPLAFAAWFGLIATALNLMPFGQLDGGHITYAVFGRRATAVSLATVAVAVGLTSISASWLVVTLMMLAMLFTVGARHPRVLDEHTQLDTTRRWIAAGCAVILILCFTPAPIEPYQLIANP